MFKQAHDSSFLIDLKYLAKAGLPLMGLQRLPGCGGQFALSKCERDAIRWDADVA